MSLVSPASQPTGQDRWRWFLIPSTDNHPPPSRWCGWCFFGSASRQEIFQRCFSQFGRVPRGPRLTPPPPLHPNKFRVFYDPWSQQNMGLNLPGNLNSFQTTSLPLKLNHQPPRPRVLASAQSLAILGTPNNRAKNSYRTPKAPALGNGDFRDLAERGRCGGSAEAWQQCLEAGVGCHTVRHSTPYIEIFSLLWGQNGAHYLPHRPKSNFGQGI